MAQQTSIKLDFKPSKKVKALAITFTLGLSLALTGCIQVGSAEAVKTYDDEALLMKSGDTFGIEKDTQEVIKDHNFQWDLSMTGRITVWTIDCKEDTTVTMPYDMSVQSGKAKLIVSNNTDEVTTLLELIPSNATATQKGTLSFKLKKGLHALKIVGKDKAQIHLDLTCDQGTFQALEM